MKENHMHQYLSFFVFHRRFLPGKLVFFVPPSALGFWRLVGKRCRYSRPIKGCINLAGGCVLFVGAVVQCGARGTSSRGIESISEDLLQGDS